MRLIERHALLALSTILALACDGGRAPVAIDARIDPSRLWYHTGQDVLLTGFVTDALGESIEDVEVQWTAEPASAVTGGDPLEDPRQARFTLGTTGTVVFTGCVVPADAAQPPTLCDSIDVRVDDGMPSLEVETPTPGAELSDPEGIVVRGSVADRSVVRVYVNGQLAEVDDMGRFETTVPALFGVNHLLVDASDGLTDASQVEMDVLWASEYTPALSSDGRPELSLPDGLALRLGQPFFDDGTPLDTTATPVVTRDLADLLELVVSHIDANSLVPDPVVDNPPTFTLRVTSVELGQPRAQLDLTDEGAELFVRLDGVTAQTSGALIVEGTSLPLTGSIRGSAVAFARLTIRKESEDAELEVTLADLAVGLESLEGSFESTETAAVFRLAEGLFRTTIEDLLVDAVRDTLETSVPQVLRDALGAVDSALAGQTITLDSAPFPPISLRIGGGIATLDSAYRRELLATLRTTIGTDVTSLHPDSRGVARVPGVAMTPEFFRDGNVSLGVRLAVLNGLLHGLWSSGLLDVDVTELLPEAVRGLVSEAHLIGRLPPVLRPARADESDDLVLSVGQLELEVVFMGAPARFAVSIDAGVTLAVEGNSIALGVAETPVIRAWTLVPASNPRTLSAETVRTLLVQLWPMLRSGVADGLALDLPLPALGDLGGLAPDLAGLTLELETADRVRERHGVVVLDARLLGTLP